MPVDVPKVLLPSLDKLDLAMFIKDLPKWKEWLSAASLAEYQQIITDLHKSVDNANSHTESRLSWPLTRLTDEVQEVGMEQPTASREDIFQKDQQTPQVRQNCYFSYFKIGNSLARYLKLTELKSCCFFSIGGDPRDDHCSEYGIRKFYLVSGQLFYN